MVMDETANRGKTYRMQSTKQQYQTDGQTAELVLRKDIEQNTFVAFVTLPNKSKLAKLAGGNGDFFVFGG